MKIRHFLLLAAFLIPAIYLGAPRTNGFAVPADLKDSPNSGDLRDFGVQEAKDAGGAVPEVSTVRTVNASGAAAAAQPSDPPSIIKSMPAADTDPVKSLAYNVLRYMAATLRWHGDVDKPKPREPHEWSGMRVLAEGNFNGCVEAAKAFKALYDASGPAKRAVFVGGTQKGRDGGHAVIELAGSDNTPFIVDTVLFQQVPHKVGKDPLPKTMQTPGKEDIVVAQKGASYVLSRYQYSFRYAEDRRLGPDLKFKDLRAVDDWLSLNAAALPDFAALAKARIVKPETDGTFIGPQGEVEHIYLKTEKEPFSGTDRERAESGQRALEDKVKNGR